VDDYLTKEILKSVKQLNQIDGTEFEIRVKTKNSWSEWEPAKKTISPTIIGKLAAGQAQIQPRCVSFPMDYATIQMLMDKGITFQYRCKNPQTKKWGKWHNWKWLGPVMFSCAQGGLTQWRIKPSKKKQP